MNQPYSFFENLASLIPDIPADSIVSRTIFQDDQVKAVLFGFAQGQELSEHTASQPALLLFLSGEADLTLGETKMKATSGTFVHIAAQLSHSVHASTPVMMLLLLLKTQGRSSN